MLAEGAPPAARAIRTVPAASAPTQNKPPAQLGAKRWSVTQVLCSSSQPPLRASSCMEYSGRSERSPPLKIVPAGPQVSPAEFQPLGPARRGLGPAAAVHLAADARWGFGATSKYSASGRQQGQAADPGRQQSHPDPCGGCGTGGAPLRRLHGSIGSGRYRRSRELQHRPRSSKTTRSVDHGAWQGLKPRLRMSKAVKIARPRAQR